MKHRPRHPASRCPSLARLALLLATLAGAAQAHPYGPSRPTPAPSPSPVPSMTAPAPAARVPVVYPPPDPARAPSSEVSRNPLSYPPAPRSPLPTAPQAIACPVIANCSFETGTFAGWITTDITNPFVALLVGGPGLTPGYGLFTSAPTDGGFAVLNGFDGAGPGNIVLAQDVVLPPTASRLEFDYRAGWDMVTYTGSTLPRKFLVEIQPSGGGATLQSSELLTALPATRVLDTGPQGGSVNLAPFAGKAVRIVFRWNVPEYFTGPAFFQLDRIAIRESLCIAIDNCSFETAGFPSWTATDLPGYFFPLSVSGAGVSPGYGLFTSAPSDGGYAAICGFDGDGPGDIVLSQDVTLPPDAYSLEFDYRAGWDMLTFAGSTLPRTFAVEIQPSGGGGPLLSQQVLVAWPATQVLDSGPRKGIVDVSAFQGLAVRIVFRWHIPQSFTGPGFFQLDRITLSRALCVALDNCSFEAGAFPAWNAVDMIGPLYPLHVGTAGENIGFGFFTSAPTHGTQAAIHGFDGAGPGTIALSQDVTLPSWVSLLRFDYRAAWDMFHYPGSTQARLFKVEVEPSGGGPALQSDVVLAAMPATLDLDTGPMSRTIPVAAFAGSSIRLVFRWEIPENFTGPGFFQLDNVSFNDSPLDVANGPRPGRLSLASAMPNPSHSGTAFQVLLPEAGEVELEIVDLRGARVWSERHASLPAGEHVLSWDGRRLAGGTAPGGVYFARVRARGEASTRMFVRVR